ncbi:MAG: heavy metal translocating P-type ATPase [Pseudomonadota bacterium]
MRLPRCCLSIFRSLAGAIPLIPENAAASTRPACFHCGLAVPSGDRYRALVLGESREMCCAGCQAVAEAIVAGGLDDFYRQRTEPGQRPQDEILNTLKSLAIYDNPAIQRSFVSGSGDVREAVLILEGITCAACLWLNERHVNALAGVVEFRINYTNHRARVRWDNRRLLLSEIFQAIAAIGYRAHPFDPHRQEGLYLRERSLALRRLGVAGFGMMQVMMLAVAWYGGTGDLDPAMETFLRWVSLVLTLPVLTYSAYPFFWGAWRDLRRGQAGMDVPVALGLSSAFLASLWFTILGGGEVYYDSVTMFTFLLLTGRFLELAARHKAAERIDALARLIPAMTLRIGETADEWVPVGELVPGDRVRVRPGETLPADGVVLEGLSTVDEALLTGESLPRLRQPGDALVGGTVNRESPLVMRVDRVGEETLLSAIVRLLDRAQSEKPRITQLADRVAGRFVGALLGVAVGVALWWYGHEPARAFEVTLAVLIISCPCALSLATPAALAAATGTLARLGLLTTRSHALETLTQVTQVVFDKTGTLTLGALRLLAIAPEPGVDPARALALAAALEQGSEHPVARAIVTAAAAAGEVEIRTSGLVENTPGAGIQGLIDGHRYRLGTPAYVRAFLPEGVTLPPDPQSTHALLVGPEGLLASFTFRDPVRPGAAASLQALRQQGLRVSLLSGDNPGSVAQVAAALGISPADAHAGLTPADKLSWLKARQHTGERLVMVGDGVNDAPVLAAADVSVAMGGGAALAQASADMVLLSERLQPLTAGIIMARRTFRIIRENLWWALGYNLIGIPLAATGRITPWLAAVGMSLSSLVVVLNALRLTRWSPWQE